MTVVCPSTPALEVVDSAGSGVAEADADVAGAA